VKQRLIPEELQRLLPLTPAMFFVLFSLASGEKHGYAIMQGMAELSGDKVRMGPATLYTTLQRLLDLALVEETRASSTERDTRRRYYRLTASGATLLEAELSRMDSVLRLAKRKKLMPRIAE
jgi:DNA-binding PadR family transcriptional regulator